MIKHLVTATFTTLTVLTISSLPIHAQPTFSQAPTAQTISVNLNRAQNLARQAAENKNGGLQNYRAESSMFGPASESPYINNGNGTLTFTFKGRRPESSEFTIETVVTVAEDASTVTVDYNGPIRSNSR
jgi:hypothetical protein